MQCLFEKLARQIIRQQFDFLVRIRWRRFFSEIDVIIACFLVSWSWRRTRLYILYRILTKYYHVCLQRRRP